MESLCRFTLQEFIARAQDGSRLAGLVETRLVAAGYPVTEGEYRSWQNSLSALAGLLSDTSLDPGIQVGLEVRMPLSGRRADVILAGADGLVVLELKQWRQVSPSSDPCRVMTRTGGCLQAVLHPCLQAAGYVSELVSWNQVLQERALSLHGAVWLHNMDRQQGELPLEVPGSGSVSLFFAGDGGALIRCLQSSLGPAPAGDLLGLLQSAPVRPGPGLRRLLTDMIRPETGGSSGLPALCQPLFAQILSILKDSRPSLMVVTGGCGTGKTALALQLLFHCLHAGQSCLLTFGTAGLRHYMRDQLDTAGGLPPAVFQTLQPLAAFGPPVHRQAEVILVDEAHRLTRRDRPILPAKAVLSPDLDCCLRAPMLDWLADQSRHLVLFLDESQRVSPDDGCTLADIRRCVALHNRTHPQRRKTLRELPPLRMQLRCAGGAGFPAWVDKVLDRAGEPLQSTDAVPVCSGYEFHILPTPQAVVRALDRKKAAGDSVRLCAGRCWPQSRQKPEPEGRGFHIGPGFRGIWKTDCRQAPAPAGYRLVDSVQDIQGQEADWTGVFIGPDLVYRHDRVQTDWRARSVSDRLMGGLQARVRLRMEEQEEADDVIRNTYRVLLTRARKGCFVWCADRALGRHLQALFAPAASPSSASLPGLPVSAGRETGDRN